MQSPLMAKYMTYGGSGAVPNRWEYAPGSGAGSAELDKGHVPSGEEFFKMLKEVVGVTKVKWNTRKTSQGNIGDHYMERNILVTSSLGPGSASHPFEFELTRHAHMKDSNIPFTVTAMFKEPSPDVVPEAWRILCEVVKGKEFAPVHVENYCQKVLAKWDAKELDSQRAARDADAPPDCKTEPPDSDN